MADIETINLELILADLESVNKQYNRVEKVAKTKDKAAMAELAVLDKIKPVLEAGKSVRTIEFSEDEQAIVKGLFLLTAKPVLYVANVAEDDVQDPTSNQYVQKVQNFAATENAEVITVCAQIEEEIAELDDEDKAEFLEDLGIKESGLDQLIRASFNLLGLATYFTAGNPKFVLGPSIRELRRHKQQVLFIRILNVVLFVLRRYLLLILISMKVCMQQKKLVVFDLKAKIMLFKTVMSCYSVLMYNKLPIYK